MLAGGASPCQKYPRRRRHQQTHVGCLDFAALCPPALPAPPGHPASSSRSACCKACAGSRHGVYVWPSHHTPRVETPPALCCACMLHVADVHRAWISGHPREKAPTVDRTGPGMAWAWRGRACYTAAKYRYGYSQCLGPGIGSAGEASKVKVTSNRGHARDCCANTSSCAWRRMAG